MLRCEQVELQSLAESYGTPLYVYSKAALESGFTAWQDALSGLPHLICYAVKANSNIAILQCLAKLGAGFDIVSGGELARVMMAGGDPNKVVFSGVGKTPAEIRNALDTGIRCFNVESASELRLLESIAAETKMTAPVSIRVNPDVDAQTHPYISTGLKENKFGVDEDTALKLYQQAQASDHLNPVGIDCHIGSQLTDISPYLEAVDHLLGIVDRLGDLGISLEHIDIGGGLGIQYRQEPPTGPIDLIESLKERFEHRGLEVVVEPGRSIVGNAGVLLSEVVALKHGEHKNFAIVDAGMNDLIRPSLYQGWHDITPLAQRDGASLNYDVVGPVCETGDFLGKDRDLRIEEGDVLAVMSAGAYGFVMASNYNSRPRAAELLIDGHDCHVVRQRETIATLVADEALLPDKML
ncbi:MAG: diaminopimelate decarboxylase [Halieaceae bacterium MED-G27]|nr:MAG: diaminopimelate decarboxylase [Halieaceae bacterium MED-G27]|tara:strand:- start:3072 stop:4301 length:1230 start_codon:yes stop_codon:yes gene_type:complete